MAELILIAQIQSQSNIYLCISRQGDYKSKYEIRYQVAPQYKTVLYIHAYINFWVFLIELSVSLLIMLRRFVL